MDVGNQSAASSSGSEEGTVGRDRLAASRRTSAATDNALELATDSRSTNSNELVELMHHHGAVSGEKSRNLQGDERAPAAVR